MARVLGIDYGEKRIGIALSDEAGVFAFPETIVHNDARAIAAIAAIAREKGVVLLVLGHSTTFEGKDNTIMDAARAFGDALARATRLPFTLHSEVLTTAQARRQHEDSERKKRKRERLPVDASAATLMLQSYLDVTIHHSQPHMTHNPQKDNTADTPGRSNTVPQKISIEQFKAVEMKVGEILTAERVPDTDKLIRLTVNVGENTPRQIISGIATWFPDPSVLVGKRVPFVTNLAPRTMRGLESNGMILAAHDDEGNFSLLEVSHTLAPGARLS